VVAWRVGIALFLVSLSYGALAEPITVNDIAVVDGDTIDAHGQRYRMIGYDTPEVKTPRRKVGPDERAVAIIAKERFTELLSSGALDLTEVPCSCSAKKLQDGACNHGRKCAILSLNGKNIGDALIAEELAVPYVCSTTRCPRMPDWPSILERQMK
jgi:endonuclease YncB( thermonuclease family)